MQHVAMIYLVSKTHQFPAPRRYRQGGVTFHAIARLVIPDILATYTALPVDGDGIVGLSGVEVKTDQST